MDNESSLATIRRCVDRFMIAAVVLLALSAVLMVLSAVIPIGADVEASSVASVRQLQPLPKIRANLEPLVAKMAGRHLIKPSQVQAAVKDTGIAQRLAKKLKLQGVVQVGTDLIAYVSVEKQGTKTVRQGEKLLDFVVQKIEPGKVTLSLQGVQVVLGH